MGKRAPSPPPIPDQNAIVAQQTAANKETALLQGRLSNPRRETTPYGTMTNIIDPSGNIDRTLTLNPAEQANLDRQRDLTSAVTQGGVDQAGRIRDTLGRPIEDAYKGLPEVSADISSGLTPRTTSLSREGLPDITGRGDFSADADRVRQAVFQQGSGLLNQQFDARRKQLETDLVNKGFRTGTEGFSGAVQNFEQLERNPAMADLALRSIAAGGAEQSRLFGMDAGARSQLFGERGTQADFANRARAGALQENIGVQNQAQNVRNQLIQERLGQRNQPLNELAVLMGSSPGVQTGSYAGLTPTAVNPTDVVGSHAIQSQAQQNAFNQANANYQANLSGMYGLAGAAATGGMYGMMRK